MRRYWQNAKNPTSVIAPFLWIVLRFFEIIGYNVNWILRWIQYENLRHGYHTHKCKILPWLVAPATGGQLSRIISHAQWTFLSYVNNISVRLSLLFWFTSFVTVLFPHDLKKYQTRVDKTNCWTSPTVCEWKYYTASLHHNWFFTRYIDPC